MKTINRVLSVVTVLLAVLLLITDARANGCRVAIRRNIIVQKQAVVIQKAVVIKEVVPVTSYAYNNLYGATYQPDGLLEAFKLLFQQNQTLIGQTQQLLNDRGQQGPVRGGQSPMRQAEEPLVGGQLAEITPDQNAALLSRIVKGEMPKGVKTTADERLRMVDIVTSGSEAEVAQLYQAQCASCHSAVTAKSNGNGFILLK